jgi:histidyl-tRNA synthetase
MEKIKPMSGFIENLPEKQIIEDKFKNIIKNNYSLSGFVSLDIPIIERVETLISK